METTDNVFILSHACALCKNLTDLREPCCCSEDSSEMIEVTETRLLKRGNLSRGEHLCRMHYDKLKSGLIFGVGSTGCCAPFHIELSSQSPLRPVPRTWRHLFDNSAVKKRYLPSLQICNQCYKITWKLILTTDQNDSYLNWDISDTSSLDLKYTSPKRWLSSLSLHTNGSTTSDNNSMFSSTSQLSTPPSSNILSLYESHREKLGYPPALPDSIKRFLRYPPTPNFGLTGKFPLRHANSFNSSHLKLESQRDDDDKLIGNKLDRATTSRIKKLSSSTSLPLPANSTDDDLVSYQTSTPKLELSSSESCGTFLRERRPVKQNMASPSIARCEQRSETFTSSCGTESDWESISISKLSDYVGTKKEMSNLSQLDYNDNKQNFEILQSSLVPKDETAKSNFKSLSISTQSCINPELKRSRNRKLPTNSDTSSTENCGKNDFRLDPQACLINKESLQEQSIKTEIDAAIRLSDDSNNNGDNDFILMNQRISKTPSSLCKMLDGSGIDHDDVTKLISLIQASQTQMLQVFANTLAKCVVGFALQDASKFQAKKANKEFSIRNHADVSKALDLKEFQNCAKCESIIRKRIEIVCFAQCQTSEIISNAYEILKNYTPKDCRTTLFRSEITFNTREAQRLRLNDFSKVFEKKKIFSNGPKTTVVWNEEKNSYQTLLTVELKENQELGKENGFASEVKSISRLIGQSSLRKTTNLPIVECVVEDIIPVSRSFSTGFNDGVDHFSADSWPGLKNSPRLVRASSFDSYFTLTCEITDHGRTFEDGFFAVPIRDIKTTETQSTSLPPIRFEHLLSKSDICSTSEDSEKSLDTFERSSISSIESDLASSLLDECKNFEAELLQHQKFTDRPHFVSHKSRIDESQSAIEPVVSVPFELKPEQTSTSEERSESSAFEPITDDDTSQYTEAMSTISASADDAPAKTPEQESKASSAENADQVFDLSPKKKHRPYDWYIGEELERRRSSQFLKALSQATILTSRTTKRREVRLRKTDEEPEDDDVPIIIGKAMDDFSPTILRRKTKNSDDEEEKYKADTKNRKTIKIVFRAVVVVGLVSVLFYAGWKLYT